MQYFTNPAECVFQDVVSLDTEYTQLDIKKADLLSIAIGFSSSKSGLFKPNDLNAIAPILQKAKYIYTQNGCVDWFMLKKAGLELDRYKFLDTMLMEHLIDENILHNLGDMVFRYYADDYKSRFWEKHSSFQEATEEDRLDYEMRDGCYTFSLGEMFEAKLASHVPADLINNVHHLYWALFDTEVEGLKVNVDLMKKTKSHMGTQISSYLPKLRSGFDAHCNLWELAAWAKKIDKYKSAKGKEKATRPQFSFASPKQLQWLVYESMGCPVISKTKTGLPSTDYETIEILSQNFPELGILAEYQRVKSVYATFVDGLLDKVENERIYPGFNVNGTRNAGRISHSNPNMGNMPKEGVIRNFFIPDDGCFIFGADYSQLEVIVEANLTEDKQLLKIINEGVSKHDITAEGLGIHRDAAKTLNFALQYGAGAYKVAEILGISQSAARDIFARYWKLYSGVQSLKEKTAQNIERDGYVKTPFGRYRHFPKPKNKNEKAKFDRQGYNALIQGTGADCTNHATWRIGEYLRDKKIGRLWFSVHDEIVGEARNGKIEEGISALTKFMEESGDIVGFKYRLKSQAYGPLIQWSKTA